MKKFTVLILAVLLSFSVSFALNHSGNTSAPAETWWAADNPHIITGDVTVPNLSTLQIEEGCVVLFNTSTALTVNGVLIADGTALNHIVFSSNAAFPVAGDWDHIYFNDADAGSVMDYCDVSYGGAINSMIRIRSSVNNVTISNCYLTYSLGNGIRLINAAANPQISDCTLEYCTDYPISTYADRVKNITGNMMFNNNTLNAVYVFPQNVTTGTWLDHGVPYVIGASFSVVDANTWTISPGTTIKFNGNYTITVNGALVANGTAADHITFTSNNATPAKGDWNRIYLSNSDAGTILNYCDISYAGSGGSGVDIRTGASNSTISNCSVQQISGYGIYSRENATPYISDCSISDCDNYPIYSLANGVKNISGTNTFVNNAFQAIWVRSGSIGTGIWNPQSVHYVLGGGDFTVSNGAVLTIMPGTDMRFNGNRQFIVNGILLAVGTDVNPIIFTSDAATPAPGDWENIMLSGVDGTTRLEYCNISYGGSQNGALYAFQNSSNFVNIKYCNISYSNTFGFYNNLNSTAAFQGGSITYCNSYAMRMGASNARRIAGWPVVIMNNNAYNAIRLDAQTVNYDGTWWNHYVPYVIFGDIVVADEIELTIWQGCQLNFNSGARLEVQGTLKALGVNSNHITFTSNQAVPAPGDWERIYLNGADAGTVFNYCDIYYGGGTNAAIDMDNCISNVALSHLMVKYSTNKGIYLRNGSSPSILNCEITDNDTQGIDISGDCSPSFGINDTEWNRIYNNGSYELRNGTLDIEAKYIYWGTEYCGDVSNYIYDQVDNASLGLVDYIPWLDGSLGIYPLATTWTGAVDNTWDENGNWTEYAPCDMTNVIIPAAPANQPSVFTDETCNDLTMEPGSKLTVISGNDLDVTGNFVMQAGAAGTSSLIETGGLNVTGNTEIQFYVTADRWHYVSSPMANQIANVFYDMYLYDYIETTDMWHNIVDEFTPLTPGLGYRVWSSSNPPYAGTKTVSYTNGTIQQGNYYLPVTRNGSGWNLVGNPYPSAIDWDNLSWTKTNIDGTVYVWDGVQYISWNGSTGDLTDGVIPAMQAFFVKATAASPVLRVTNPARLHGVDPYKADPIDNQLILSVTGNGYSDKTFVSFNQEATQGFDSRFDGYKLYGLTEAPQLYTILDSEILRVNVMSELSSDLVIPVGLEVSVETEYTIVASGIASFGTSAGIFLEDKLLGLMIDLTEQPDYTFTANPLDAPQRFTLHFFTLGVEDQPVSNENTADALTIYSAGNCVYVRNNEAGYNEGFVVLMNISGQEVSRANLQNVTLNKFDLNVKPGYYIVKVITDTGVYTEKVFIK
jgi:hypothetical protein